MLDDGEAKVILRINEGLSLQEAVKLLHSDVKNPTEMVSFVPPVKPSAGDVSVYHLEKIFIKMVKLNG